MIRKVSSLVCVLVLIANIVGCAKVHVTNTPPGVSDKEVALWYQATGAIDTWSKASGSLTTAAIILHQQFPSENLYQGVLAALGKESQLGLQASYTLQGTANHFTSDQQTKLGQLLDKGLSALSDINASGLDQIKDPKNANEVATLVASLKSALTIIFQIVNPGVSTPQSLK